MSTEGILLRGGGDTGSHLDLPMAADSNLLTILEALRTAETTTTGVLVRLATSGNYTVTDCAANEIPHGKIIAAHRVSATNWKLTVRLWAYTDQNSNTYPAHQIIHCKTTSGVALGDTVIGDTMGSTYNVLTDGTSGGFGFVIADDTPTTGEFDLLI
jgi:hypothetical protein